MTRNMTGQLVDKPRGNFMEAAQKEMIAFELRERELRKQERLERAEQLRMPALKPLHSSAGALDYETVEAAPIAASFIQPRP